MNSEIHTEIHYTQTGNRQRQVENLERSKIKATYLQKKTESRAMM